MHRNFILLLIGIAMLAVVYGVFTLTHRAMPKQKRLSAIHRWLGVKLFALLGVVGCENVIDPGPDSLRGDSDDTETADTDTAISADTATGSDTVADTGVDNDTATDTGLDTSVYVDTDSGSCSGVTCYEKVAAPTDKIFIDHLPIGSVISVDGSVLLGSYDRLYALIPCYRLLDSNGIEVSAANINGTPLDADNMQFRIFLPANLTNGTYQLYLYGTTIENVREYQTYPAKQYTLEVQE